MKFFACAIYLVSLLATPTWSQSGKPTSPADLAAYARADREKVLLEGAKREGKVVWYTTLAAEQNKQIANAFETKYPGVRVETFRTGSSALAQRVLTEAKAQRHLADAIETTLPGLLTFRETSFYFRTRHLISRPFPTTPKKRRPTTRSFGPTRGNPISDSRTTRIS